MDQGRPQPPKDFPNLSHGQEWVTFYESFDKLVQDHLSRSSDLLRRAMSLPEVAEREVQQVRSDLEGKIHTERSGQVQLLAELKAHVEGSRSQVSALASALGDVLTDLSSLNARVDAAMSATRELLGQSAPSSSNGASLASVASATSMPTSVAPAADAPTMEQQDAPAEESISDVSMETLLSDFASEGGSSDAGEASSEGEMTIDLSAVAEVEETSTETASETEAASGASTEESTDAVAATSVEEQVAEMSEGSSEGAATAEAGSEATTEEGPDAAKATNGATEHQRPHWLSVTRIGSSRP